MKFNLNMFWVLFLVLVIQGDTNQIVQEDTPVQLVSVKDATICHICTGSIIAEYWVLTNYFCMGAMYVFYGPREEFGKCSERNSIYISPIMVNKVWNPILLTRIFKVNNSLDNPQMDLPINSNLPKTGVVMGWSFDNIGKFVMRIIHNVNIKDAFSGKKKYPMIDQGSPLIARDNIIYGVIGDSTGTVNNILFELDNITKAMQTQSTN